MARPSDSDFDLHEDEWGMISLEADENRFERTRMVKEAAAFGEAHRAPGGVGWTDLHVAPAAPIELSTRQITLSDLQAALGPGWIRYPSVWSGYSSFREELHASYAFYLGDSNPREQIYGSLDGPYLASLCITKPSPAIGDTLHVLGTTFRLILCDLWKDTVVALGDRAALERYLAPEPD
jgi:hypothetical protein